MASIGHVAIGWAAARGASSQRWPGLRLTLLLSALSLLPDADVVGFYLGVPYGAPWGHRGATHSLVFALLVALLATRAKAWFRLSLARVFLLVFVVVASHGLLDALTSGGRGVALFWPFSAARHFAPWRPIPVAPIGLRFFSARGLWVACRELALFAPFFVYAMWPRRNAH